MSDSDFVNVLSLIIVWAAGVRMGLIWRNRR